MAAGRWVGRGDKNGADQAAVDAMRRLVGTVRWRGVVVIGEGEKDDAPMLYNGEEVGDGTGRSAMSPSTRSTAPRLTAKGMSNAISVMAVSRARLDVRPSAVFYMEKLVAGSAAAAGMVDINAPVATNIRRVAKAKGIANPDVTVAILERPRHDPLVNEIREAGARVKLHPGRRCGRRRHGRQRRHRRRSPARHRRHPGGHHRRLRREVPRRRHPGQAVAARRGRAAKASTPATTSTRSSPPAIWSPATTCSSSATGVTDGELVDEHDSMGDVLVPHRTPNGGPRPSARSRTSR
jgi:hypothetical protein